jgi:superfamily II DNA or RNA helicase
MPTGTGETDTMLSALVSACCRRVLVIVPTDALRAQIAEKFLTLGVLKVQGAAILADGALHPSVCVLRQIPTTAGEVDKLFSRAHVIVTTSSIAGSCEPEVQQAMAAQWSHLFIDEAHHAEARTWSEFKDRFTSKRVLQFTATPFRGDGKPLDGKLVYVYPLEKAQTEGYFKPIRFVNVVEFDPNRADQVIAAKAIEQLRVDFDKGHILMARVETVVRAEKVFKTRRILRDHRVPTSYRAYRAAAANQNLCVRVLIRNQWVGGSAPRVVFWPSLPYSAFAIERSLS